MSQQAGARQADPAMLDALLAQARAEALRSQRDFFLSVDMPIAADHCEEAAIAWDHSRAIRLEARRDA